MASATNSEPTVIRCSRPAAYAPGSRGTPNHSITYGVEHDTRAATATQLNAAIARRTDDEHRSSQRAQRLNATPMSAIVENAQNAA